MYVIGFFIFINNQKIIKIYFNACVKVVRQDKVFLAPTVWRSMLKDQSSESDWDSWERFEALDALKIRDRQTEYDEDMYKCTCT